MNLEEISVGESTGYLITGSTIPEAQRLVDKNRRQGFIPASLPLLFKGFPYNQWLVANSEDIVGPDVEGLFGPRSACVVATFHGGSNGLWGLLEPGIYDEARIMCARGRGGMNALNAIVLNDVYGADVFRNMLDGQMSNPNRIIDVFRYGEQLPTDGREYIVVRSLREARQTSYGVKPIADLMNEKKEVTDSQLIVYAGGKRAAKKVVRAVLEHFLSERFGLRHPYNQPIFDPSIPQGNLIQLGVGTFGAYPTFSSLKTIERYSFVVVRPGAFQQLSR